MTGPSGAIRVGIGGWVFPPWRNNFYPEGLAQKSELEYASRQLSAIEINATYHRLQKPASFAKWRDATPSGFVFSIKGSQYVTNRRVLGEAGEAIGKFMASGLAELGPKLGPIVWQFATTKIFDPDDFDAFLQLLPGKLERMFEPGADTSGRISPDPDTGPRLEKPDISSLMVVDPTTKLAS